MYEHDELQSFYQTLCTENIEYITLCKCLSLRAVCVYCNGPETVCGRWRYLRPAALPICLGSWQNSVTLCVWCYVHETDCFADAGYRNPCKPFVHRREEDKEAVTQRPEQYVASSLYTYIKYTDLDVRTFVCSSYLSPTLSPVRLLERITVVIPNRTSYKHEEATCGKYQVHQARYSEVSKSLAAEMWVYPYG
jgi:hypothetical protein